MTTRHPLRLTAIAAFAAGLLVVGVAVAAWRVPRGDGRLGLDARVLLTSSGELDVSPPGPILSGTALEPGRSATGGTTVRNQTGRTLLVSVRALPDLRAADSTVGIEVDAGATRLYSGTLGGLRQTTRAAIRLAPTQAVRMRLRIWVPAAARVRSRGQIVDVPLELPVRAVGGRG
jgi:hypothetical protein